METKKIKGKNTFYIHVDTTHYKKSVGEDLSGKVCTSYHVDVYSSFLEDKFDGLYDSSTDSIDELAGLISDTHQSLVGKAVGDFCKKTIEMNIDFEVKNGYSLQEDNIETNYHNGIISDEMSSFHVDRPLTLEEFNELARLLAKT